MVFFLINVLMYIFFSVHLYKLFNYSYFKFCPKTAIINSIVCGKFTFIIVSYNDNIQTIPSSFKSFIKDVVKLNN